MASKANTIVQKIEIDLDNKEAIQNAKEFSKATTKALEKIEDASKKASGKPGGGKTGAGGTGISGLTGAIFKANIGMKIFDKVAGAVTKTLQDGVRSALEYEKTTIALQTAIASTGADLGVMTEILQAQSAAMEESTGISDEQIRSLQTLAISMGTASEDASRMAKAAIAMSRAMGTDAKTAMLQLAKSMSGVLEETTRMIPGVAGLTKEQLKSGAAIDKVLENWDKFASLDATGASGQLTLMSNAFGSLAEEIFKTSANTGILTRAVEDLTTAAQLATRFVAEGDIGGALGAVFGAGTTTNKQLLEGIKKFETADLASKQIQATIAGEGGQKAGGVGGGLTPEQRKKRKADELKQIQKDGDIFLAETARILQTQNDFKALLRDLEEVEADEKFVRDIEREQFGADERIRIAQETANAQRFIADQAANTVSSAMGIVQNSIASGIVSVIEGSEEGAGAMAIAMVKALGTMLIAQGVRHLFEAAGFSIESFGLDPRGPALAALGAKELAVGTVMTASGVALAGSASGSGGGGNSGGAGGASFNGGSGTAGGAAETKSIIVNLNGPVLSSVDAGVQIKRALDQATKVGF